MKNNKTSLKIKKIIPLPMPVETHAISIEWNDELWILINAAASNETLVFRLNTFFAFEKIPTLPLLATSAIACNQKMLVGGANKKGNPFVISMNRSGKILWKKNMEITPVIWPVLDCDTKIFIVWQENQNEIARGRLDLETSKIEKLSPIIVANPPAVFFPLQKTILARVSEKNNTYIINLKDEEIYEKEISPSTIVGETMDQMFYSWQESDSICIKLQKEQDPQCIIAKKSSLGNLKPISGHEPTVWAQGQEMTIDGDYRWQSTIFQKNTDPFEIEGFVYCISQWKNTLAIIQNSKLVLVEKVRTNK